MIGLNQGHFLKSSVDERVLNSRIRPVIDSVEREMWGSIEEKLMWRGRRQDVTGSGFKSTPAPQKRCEPEGDCKSA